MMLDREALTQIRHIAHEDTETMDKLGQIRDICDRALRFSPLAQIESLGSSVRHPPSCGVHRGPQCTCRIRELT